MRPDDTEIRINQHGSETHESWLLVRANRVSGGSAHLFDSEITHQHYIEVNISQCSRDRDLNRDRLREEKTILSFSMSEAQWGAFVSSFGQASGVPATLSRYFPHPEIPTGLVPGAPFASRLDHSHKEVRNAGAKALAQVQEAYAELEEAYERKAGRKEMSSLLHTLKHRLGNAPGDMEFAAEALTEHAENVVTKARADIEGMALLAQQTGAQIEPTHCPKFLPGPETLDA